VDQLIELLKWPNGVGAPRDIIVKHIGARMNREFLSVWELIDLVRATDSDLYGKLKIAPVRPSADETRSGERSNLLPLPALIETPFRSDGIAPQLMKTKPHDDTESLAPQARTPALDQAPAPTQ